MSIKHYFDVAQDIKSIADKSAKEISSQVESVAFHEQDIIKEKRFIPRVDLSKPENFARYGSAKEYYAQAIKRIYSTYPYDGSLRERLEWENASTYLDLHIYDNQYPRTNGYINISGDGWGAVDNAVLGYGLPASTEYIYFKGGPNTNPNGSTPARTKFTGSNYYESSMNRESNLNLAMSSKGASVEFWLKKKAFDVSKTSKEVILDIWNGNASSSADYGRLRVELTGAADGTNPFRVSLYSGSDGFFQQSVAASTFTSASVADDKWHHYAFTFKSASAGVTSRFYVDGELNNESTIGSAGVGDVSQDGLRAYLGALITAPSGTVAVTAAGKLSGSLDEFRFWKTQRSSEEIGRFWFTQVGGGVNSDPEPFITTSEVANIDLGVYYKFNEGITGRTPTDSVILDYSGRVSNGAWTGYGTNSRNTGSAIVLSNAAVREFKDPIIYPTNPLVGALEASLEASGSAHDGNNSTTIYASMPSWIIEEDAEGTGDIRNLTQIIASYFDTLHLQTESLTNLKNIEYVSGSTKPLPFADKLLNSYGFVAPEIFLDADIFEKLADRSEDKVYEKTLQDIKNTIYQNIYNNIAYIFKTKGTMKSFRNLMRCFGIDDELVKINMYADNVEYQLRNNRRNVITADKFVNFNTGLNGKAVVYNYRDTSNANSTGYISASAALTGGFAYTAETDVLLPLKLPQSSTKYENTNAITSSIFGIHGADITDDSSTRWPTNDGVNFQVFTVRDELDSTNARFMLTGTAGGYVPKLTSSLYQNVYNNTKWNLAVRVKPEKYPLTTFVSGADSGNYIVELHGVQVESGVVLEEFTVSGTVTSPPNAFVTGSRRMFVGSHRTNVTGAVLQTSDVKVNACRFWLDDLEDETLRGHAFDTENYGTLQPQQYAYSFDTTASYGDVTKLDTLALNWEFLTNTGSNASGQFIVDDVSSGSVNLTRFGDLGDILNKQHTARGDKFPASSTAPIDRDFIVSSKLNLPEHVYSEDMVTVLAAQDQDVFTPDTRPINYFFAFEKSMYQVVSEEILNYFANLKAFNNLIGDPVNQWRPEYKSIKFLRQKFFEKVSNNELDFDKFYEFYKWFDTSLSVMLSQLIPASADFSDNILTVIESHVLERSKYQRKFPFLEREGGTNIGPSTATITIPLVSPPRPPGGISPGQVPTKRQVGASSVVPGKSWNLVHAPPGGEESKQMYWHRYLQERTQTNSDRNKIQEAIKQTYNRRVGSPVKFSMDASVAFGGVTKHPNNKPNYVFAATAPYGPVVPGGTNIPINIMLSYDTDIEELIDTSDDFYPSAKQRLGFGLDPSINTDQDRKFDGNMYAPFSLYSSSLQSGYDTEIRDKYKGGVTITNLHEDPVFHHDRSLQGPFTEKFVGGRFYRHTQLNDGTDTRTNRAEGFRLALGLESTASAPAGAVGALGIVPPNYPFIDSPSGSAPHGWLPELPTAQRLRDESAKRPLNIKNIRMTTASVGVRLSGSITHNKIGNYSKNYEIVQTAGRTQNDLFFNKQTFSFAKNPETTATRGRLPLTSSSPNPGGQLDYALPNRDGVNSNETVFVNKFNSPGSYEATSRGYLAPPHEEMSVYNALPYRNRGVINYGLSGSASVDTSVANSIKVKDQIDKLRGLDQRATLHCGQFGIDAAYGSISAFVYSTTPSWHKTNRNPRKQMLSGTTGYSTGTLYDNLYIQHAIPRSEQQYNWITASLASGKTIFGLSSPACFSASTIPELASRGIYSDATFTSLTTRIIDPVTASAHMLGFPLTAQETTSYPNITLFGGSLSDTLSQSADYFNILMTSRNGAYGYPTWKQIRTGEHKVARQLRKDNLIGQVVPPPAIANMMGDKEVGYIQPTQPNSFVDYYESPVMDNHSAVTFYLEGNFDDGASGSMSSLSLMVPYGNQLDYFAHDGLNNRLNLKIDPSQLGAYRTVINELLPQTTATSMAVVYSQRIYPAAVNVYNDVVRGRTTFTINNIWNDSRQTRSDLGGLTGSQGQYVATASIWPLDGHLNFTTTSSVGENDGSGELMNSYSRFSGSHSEIRPAATYAMRVVAGTTGSSYDRVYAGDAEWLAGTQSGKKPYQSYTSYADKIRYIGKDHTIVPEFRVSTHIETYVEDNEGDFLTQIDAILDLTGAAHATSADDKFFTTYTNTDFLKYFKVIDEDLTGAREGGNTLQKQKLSLKCGALMKFLPYKGFYPAERTLELATLFSQSYSDSFQTGAPKRSQGWRAFLEPMFSPGIIHNTIKSGIAVGNYVLVNTGSPGSHPAFPNENGRATLLPEGHIAYQKIINLSPLTSSMSSNRGFQLQKIPFEALYEPTKYFNSRYITGSNLYDTGIEPNAVVDGGITTSGLKGRKLYEMAVDNFLCETVNFFNDGLTSFESNREDDFGAVKSGSVYTMNLELYRPLDSAGNVDRAKFDMYTRLSAFGAPIAAGPTVSNYSASFSHVSPPYFAGAGRATFVFTASASGIPTLSEIFANTDISYGRNETVAYIQPAGTKAFDPRMQLDSCFNLTDYYNEVPAGTTAQSSKWLIQSKFETPVLNFAGVAYSSPPTSSVQPNTSSADQIITRGMWHQYGSIPAASDAGIFAHITAQSGSNSLAEVVGFPTGRPARIGKLKHALKLEEAVVAVPFKTVSNRRRFFTIPAGDQNSQTPTYAKLEAAMGKYVFPPRFDFTRADTVEPILMYTFEFSTNLTQQDLADMWQNLPPSIGESFEQEEVVVEDKELLDLITNNEEDVQWMVFKVKKRAAKDYEKFRRSLVTQDTTSISSNVGEYSYNWPYDYFSLVELITIDEAVQYISDDLADPVPASISVAGPIDVNIVSMATATAPGEDG